jgi:hypothetical protein
MLTSIANAWDDFRGSRTTTSVSGKHRRAASVHPAMRLLALALAPSLLACAPAPRLWAHPAAAAAPTQGPIAAERVEPAADGPAADGAVASADGASRTRVGPCRPQAAAPGDPDAALVACTFTPDRQWREWHFPGGGTLLDVYDGAALVARTSEAGDVDVVRYEIDLGRATPLTLPEPTARWRRAGFTSTGMVVGLAATGTAERPGSAWVRGAADGTLTMYALPIEADDLGVDGPLAVCVGAAGAAVASTLGWSRRVSLPAGAAPPAAAGRAGVGRAGERVRCAAGRCVIDGVARVTLRSPAGSSDPAAAPGG